MSTALYKLTTELGADITFRLPTPASDPAVAAIEAYRVKVGAGPVSYLVADVDNRQGTALVNMYMVKAFDGEGRQVTFSSVTELIHSWAPTYSYDYKWTIGDGRVLDEAVGAELRREANDLYKANINDAGIAERTTIILASADTELPAEFTRVAVQSSGTEDEEEARPAR